jgi:hypothetical protein
MNSKQHVLSVLSFALCLSLAQPAMADRKDFLETSPFTNEVKGVIEAELWNEGFKDFSQHMIELEYGASERLQLALYGVWRADGRGFHYFETKFETKLQLAPPGAWWIDTALYAEYKVRAGGNRNPEDNANELETKLILSKDVGRLNFTVNAEWDFNQALRRPEFEWKLATSYPLSDAVHVGVEYWERPVDSVKYVIPGIYVGSGDFRANLGLQIGLSDNDRFIGPRTRVSWEF